MEVVNSRFVCCIVTTILFSMLGPLPITGPIYSESNVMVGLYYYVWYPEHWDWTVLDQPVLGYYNSSDRFLVQTHLWWFENLDVDFIIVSYWGWFESAVTYDSTQTLFDIAESLDISVKLCIMVEPTGENETANNYNFTWIHNDIYNKYANLQCYFHWKDRPLLLYYNADNMTKNGVIPVDNRFTPIISGHHIEYVDWIYSAPCSGVEQQVRDRQISVMPAYDDHHFRGNPQTHNVYYQEGMYIAQWERVLDEVQAGNVDVVTIATWNEWHERTSIEPHSRNGTDASLFHAYKVARDYISRLRQHNQSDPLDGIIRKLEHITSLVYILVTITTISVATTIYFAVRKPKAKTESKAT